MLFSLAFDARIINGEHAWIKPCKFSISLSIYGLTLIWFSRFLTNHKSFFQKVCNAALAGTLVELSAIIMQVMRGTTSHFNRTTPFDHAVFWVTAAAIIPVAFGTVALFVMLLREKNLPPVIGLTLKWAVFLTVIGCIPGVMMILPDAVQDLITSAKQFDGHTVGFTEGGPGLPWIGWSTVAGDLRVAHFAGIHALQILPILGYLTIRFLGGFSTLRQELLIWDAGLTYFGCIALLTFQALSAESIVAPSAHTILLGSIILISSVASAAGTIYWPRLKIAQIPQPSVISSIAE